MILSNVEIADKKAKRRARLLLLSGVLFLSSQTLHFGHALSLTDGPVDSWRELSWLIWSCAILLLLATGGSLATKREIRALMNDDTAQSNRASAFQFGFWSAMIVSILIFVDSMLEPVGARQAVHLIMTFGAGAAIMRFALLERRSLIQ